MDLRRGRVQLPEAPNRGQPRTFAAALQALAEARRYAAMLEGVSKAQKAAEQNLLAERLELRDELAKVRDSLLNAQDELADEQSGSKIRLATAQQDLTATQQRLIEVEQNENVAMNRVKEREAQAAILSSRLKATEEQVADKQSVWEREHAEFTRLRSLYAEQAREISTLKTQAVDLTAARDELKGEFSRLTQSRDELKEKVERAEQNLAKRDADFEHQGRIFSVAKQSHEEAQAIADSLRRSLSAEKTSRVAAEQLAQDIVEAFWQDIQPSVTREEILAAELLEVRLHRDTAVAESETLATRLLDLIAPQHYREHAEAASYKPKEDPLYLLKRREVVVEDRYAQWQAAQGKRVRARRFDAEQTLVDQAYAATLSAKWKLKDHPHVRLKTRPPKWRIIGIWLDEESEKYLLEITQVRIDEMEKKMGLAALE